jgi:ATP-dependent DNA helicase 2 subunit 2
MLWTNTNEGDEQSSELLAPEDTYSYGVHRVMQAITFRAFHSSSDPIPKASEILLQSAKVPEEVLKKSRTSLDDLIRIADAKKVPPRTANKRKRGAEPDVPVKTGLDLKALLGDNNADNNQDDDLEDGQAAVTVAQNGSSSVAAIGQAHPAQDFENMVKDDALIDAAFQQIQPVLIEMVQYSLGNQTYQSTIDAFKVFRRHAIAQEESELFNTFMERFEMKMKEEQRDDFLKLMKEKDIRVITEEEASST